MMGITPLQICMDSSDWLQGTIHHHEDNIGILDSSPLSPPSGHEDMLACSRPLIERKLRPPHEQSLKCPRCESTHTKFCYYNNYSLSQPRYFCKTCRRYWTKGGTLRNIPVGGGCRKNKKQSVSNSKKSSNNESSSTSSAPMILNHQNDGGFTSPPVGLSYHNNNGGFAEMSPFSSFSLFGGAGNGGNFSLENIQAPIDFMENKYEALVGGGYDFGGLMGGQYHNSNGLTSQFGLDHGNIDTNGINTLESCQRLMIPHENQFNHHNLDYQNNHEMQDVKPNGKILSLEWHDHQAGKEQFGYNFGGLGSWTGLMNGSYGSSATNLGV